MIIRYTILPALLLLAGTIGYSQPFFPEESPVFTDSTIPRIDILIDGDSLAAIFENVRSYHEYPATFIFTAGHIKDTVEQVGFRLRGNTSRISPKKSFKVSFNTFEPGRKYHGLEKMNINGEHNDPSVIRSKLCWDMYRQMEVPAPRSNHVDLYVNGIFYGLYINVEHIDEEFVQNRFGNQDGNLYKCLWPADLVYFSNDPEDYKFGNHKRRTYDLRTNVEEDNYDDLFHFIDILNNTQDQDFPCEIEKIFNVDDYLKVLAFDVLSANWDDYSYNKNNYYLYNNTETGKFEFIPFDLDNTLGIDWFGIDWANRDIYDWANQGEDLPLHKRIMGIQKYRDQYTYYVDKMLTEIMDPSILFPVIDSIHTMIASSVENDPFYPLSYDYSFNDFNKSFDEALGAHVPIGLKPYITARVESARNALVGNNIVPIINHITSNHPRLGESPVITAFVLDDDSSTIAEVLYSLDDGPTESLAMKDDGLGSDLTAGDRIFTATLDPVSTESIISFQVNASTPGGSGTIEPCQGIEIKVFEAAYPALVINEFMAGNLQVEADEYGEYDDWLEIYNLDVNPVWLGDKYLSDDISNPSRWKLPDEILDPAEFILIWTDGQNSQGPYHTNFRLSKLGEEIGIFESPERDSRVIDYVIFGSQLDDVSYGRSTDGGSEWITFIHSTPGISNLFSSIATKEFYEEPLRIYPNPVSQGMVFFNQTISVQIYDLSGRMLGEKANTTELYVGNMPAGIYLLKFPGGQVEKILIQE